MLIGTFFLALFLVKNKNSKENKLKFYGCILISAAALTPLGWGIEFFGVNSHTPIWSYTPNNPFLLMGPLNIPLLVYIGWFLILVVCMFVIYKKSKSELLMILPRIYKPSYTRTRRIAHMPTHQQYHPGEEVCLILVRFLLYFGFGIFRRYHSLSVFLLG